MTREQLVRRTDDLPKGNFSPFKQARLLNDCLVFGLLTSQELDSDLLRAFFVSHFRSVHIPPREAASRARNSLVAIETLLSALDKHGAEEKEKFKIVWQVGQILLSENITYRKAYDSTFSAFQRKQDALETFFKKVRPEVDKLEKRLRLARRKQKTLMSFFTEEDEDFEQWLRGLSILLAKHESRQLTRARSTVSTHFRHQYHGEHTLLPESRIQIIRIVAALDELHVKENQAVDLLAEILVASGVYGIVNAAGPTGHVSERLLKRQHNKLKRKVKDRLRRILEREGNVTDGEDPEEA